MEMMLILTNISAFQHIEHFSGEKTTPAAGGDGDEELSKKFCPLAPGHTMCKYVSAKTLLYATARGGGA